MRFIGAIFRGSATHAARWRRFLALAAALTYVTTTTPAWAVVVIEDGFGDADRNNDGVVAFYDTDLNISGTWNDPTADATLIARNITEVTAATNPSDVGIVWSGIRSFDTAANLTKSNIKIINDNVPTGTETQAELLNSGLALGVESRGGGSSFIGRFNDSVSVGPVAGDKLKVSLDFRYWREAANETLIHPDFHELRWGLFEDTDNELGQSAPAGSGGASVVWGRDDGNFFARTPIGAEGDKGIYSRLEIGPGALAPNARINWEYNVLNINGTANNGRILEGSGVTDTPGTGGDVGTVASPPGNGTGGFIDDSLVPASEHSLSMEIIRLADGLIEVATFVDNVELLRDQVKTTDTGFNVIGPPAYSYDYVGFRNTADFDYVIDNFKVELFGSNATVDDADFDGDGDVDGADFLTWQRGLGTAGGQSQGNANGDAIIDAADLAIWKNQFASAVAAVGAVPEPVSAWLALAAAVGLGACGRRSRHVG